VFSIVAQQYVYTTAPVESITTLQENDALATDGFEKFKATSQSAQRYSIQSVVEAAPISRELSSIE